MRALPDISVRKKPVYVKENVANSPQPPMPQKKLKFDGYKNRTHYNPRDTAQTIALHDGVVEHSRFGGVNKDLENEIEPSAEPQAEFEGQASPAVSPGNSRVIAMINEKAMVGPGDGNDQTGNSTIR